MSSHEISRPVLKVAPVSTSVPAPIRLTAPNTRSRGDERKFEAFRQWLINRPKDLSFAALAVGSLIVHEGVIHHAALVQAFEALNSTFQVGDRTILQWQHCLDSPKSAQARSEDWRRDERQLSAWTVLAINEIEHWPSAKETMAELDTELRRARFANRGLPDNLGDAARVVNAALRLLLPSFLHAHCEGKQMLTPLPRSAYLRLETGFAPPIELDEHVESGRALREIELAEATHSLKKTEAEKGLQRISGAQRAADEHLFSGIKQALGSALSTTHASNSEAMKKRRMNDLLEVLSRDARGCSWWAQVVWHTALHLINQVDGDGNTYAASSVPRIFYGGAETLYRHLQNVAPGNINREAFTQAVQDAANGLKNTGHLHAFANCMVDYLAQFDLIDPLYFSSVRRLPPPIKANTVFPHEFSRMRQWLASAIAENPHSRVMPALRCALEILEATGVRSNELLRIRLDRIALTPTQIQIVLDPLRSDPDLKTDGSRRRIYVARDQRSEGLIHWIRRRLEEEGLNTTCLFSQTPQIAVMSYVDLEANAPINRHLFGVPGTPGRFRDLPILLKGLSMMLKSATGDPSISVHTTRHAFVSNQVETAIKDVLIRDDWDNSNPLAEVGTLSGHRGQRSLLQVYSHHYAHLIRLTLDADVLARDSLNPTALAKWLPLKRNTLQKQLDRSSLRGDSAQAQLHLMAHLNAHAQICAPTRISSQEDVCRFVEPGNPLRSIRDHDLDLTQTLCAIEDMLNINDEVRISLRRGLTPDLTRHLVAAFDQAEASLNTRNDPLLPRPRRRNTGAFAGGTPGLRNLWRKFGFRWRQPKWEKLLNHLESVRDDASLDGLIEFWVKHPTFPHFALPADRRVLNAIFAILRGADFRADHVHIAVDFDIPAIGMAPSDRINKEDGATRSIYGSDRGGNSVHSWLDAVCAAYQSAFNVMPEPVQRRRRGNRPGIYLLLGPRSQTSFDPEQIKNGSGLSVQGLHAMLLALFIYRWIVKGVSS